MFMHIYVPQVEYIYVFKEMNISSRKCNSFTKIKNIIGLIANTRTRTDDRSSFKHRKGCQKNNNNIFTFVPSD